MEAGYDGVKGKVGMWMRRKWNIENPAVVCDFNAQRMKLGSIRGCFFESCKHNFDYLENLSAPDS